MVMKLQVQYQGSGQLVKQHNFSKCKFVCSFFKCVKMSQLLQPISSCALMSDVGTEKIWTLPLHEAGTIS